MTEVVYGCEDELLPWALKVIGLDMFRPDAKAIGLKRDGEIVAVTVYDGFSQCDCNMHIASDGSKQWLSRAFLTASFAYPFIQLGLRRVTGLVPSRNSDALRFDTNLGFEFEGLCRDALPDDDIIILGMRKAHCRFIPLENRNG